MCSPHTPPHPHTHPDLCTERCLWRMVAYWTSATASKEHHHSQKKSQSTPKDFAKGEQIVYVTEWGWLTSWVPVQRGKAFNISVQMAAGWTDGHSDAVGRGLIADNGRVLQVAARRAFMGAIIRKANIDGSTWPADTLKCQCSVSSAFLSLFFLKWICLFFFFFFFLVLGLFCNDLKPNTAMF